MNELLWYLSRASGVVCLTLITAVLGLGAWMTVSRRPERTAVLTGVHRTLALGSLGFLAAHVLTAIAETYVSIDLVSLVLPFSSAYQRAWVGLGTLAMDLLATVTVTALLRNRLGRTTFRWIHRSVWAVWAVAVVHGLALSSASPIGLRLLTLGCGTVGALALAARLLAPAGRDLSRRRLINAQEWT